MKQILLCRLHVASTLRTVNIAVVIVLAFGLNAQTCSNPDVRDGVPVACPGQSLAASHTVTLQQLRHVIPKNAKKEIAKAKQALAKHLTGETIDHLKNVIRLDPEGTGARNDLAVVYLRMNNPDAAIDQLEAAIKIDPRSPIFFENLALSYLALHTFDAAERAARTAVDLDKAEPYPLYLLGTTLVYQHKFTSEALRCLEKTDDQYWLGHLLAARILIAQGNLGRAKSEIQTYLSDKERRDPDPAYARIIANWLNFIEEGERNPTAALSQ